MDGDLDKELIDSLSDTLSELELAKNMENEGEKKPKKVQNRTLLLLFLAFIIGFFIWAFVSIYEKPDTEETISNIEINMTLDSSLLNHYNITPVGWEGQKVSVRVYGNRMELAKLTPADFLASLVLDPVDEAGSFELRVEVTTDRTNFDIVPGTVSPALVTVHFDNKKTIKLKVTPELSEYDVAEGYVRGDAIISPAEVSITGPESQIDRIVAAKVTIADIPPVLEESFSDDGSIVLVDAKGQVIDLIEISLDKSSAYVTVPVNLMKELPIEVLFLNMPASFPIEEFKYKLSKTSILVAGPKKTIESMDNIKVGPVNFKNIDDGDYIEVLPITLPANCENIEAVSEIAFSLEMPELETLTLNTNIINIVNLPNIYTAEIKISQIKNIVIVGAPAILETLTGEDIFAQIDFSDREIKPGQVTVPVKIVIPGTAIVWATGDYTVVVEISEKDE